MGVDGGQVIEDQYLPPYQPNRYGASGRELSLCEWAHDENYLSIEEGGTGLFVQRESSAKPIESKAPIVEITPRGNVWTPTIIRNYVAKIFGGRR